MTTAGDVWPAALTVKDHRANGGGAFHAGRFRRRLMIGVIAVVIVQSSIGRGRLAGQAGKGHPNNIPDKFRFCRLQGYVGATQERNGHFHDAPAYVCGVGVDLMKC